MEVFVADKPVQPDISDSGSDNGVAFLTVGRMLSGGQNKVKLGCEQQFRHCEEERRSNLLY
jgi:hypothetical protein